MIILHFNADNATTNSFEIKEKITDQTSDNGQKDIEIMVPLKYVINILKTLEEPLINCKIIIMATNVAS